MNAPPTPPAILQGGRLGGKRGVKAVQGEVFLPGTDDPPSLGRYPAPCFVTRGCSSFGFVGLVIFIITFIRMFQMYFGGEGDFVATFRVNNTLNLQVLCSFLVLGWQIDA